MNKSEIDEFIEQMEELGDEWNEEQVERVYGDMSLEDAITKRRSELGSFFDILGTIINR